MIQHADGARAHKITVSDYRLLPEGPPYYQLIDGELFMTPAPRFRHAEVVSALVSALRSHARAHRLGSVVTAPVDVHLSDKDVFQPDILFVSTAHADRIHEDGVHGPPDLVVEVLSPSTRALDLNRKRVRYAGFGVPEAWFVDLEAELVFIYLLAKNASEPTRTLGRGSALSTSFFPGLELPVADVLDAK